MGLAWRVRGHGAMGTGQQHLSQPAHNGDERREDFPGFCSDHTCGNHGWNLGAGRDHGCEAKKFDKAKEEMHEA